MRRFFAAVVAGSTVVTLAACGFQPTSVSKPVTSSSGGASYSATSTTEAVAEGDIPGDGYFIVGQDVQPGTYKSAGPARSSGCSWSRYADLRKEEIIDNAALIKGQAILTIEPTDKMVRTVGCEPFHKVS